MLFFIIATFLIFYNTSCFVLQTIDIPLLDKYYLAVKLTTYSTKIKVGFNFVSFPSIFLNIGFYLKIRSSNLILSSDDEAISMDPIIMIILGLEKLVFICLLMTLLSETYPLNSLVHRGLLHYTTYILTFFVISIEFLPAILSMTTSSPDCTAKSAKVFAQCYSN